MMTTIIKVYLRNGLSFTFRPMDASANKPPHESEIAAMMTSHHAVSALADAVPHVVLRWSEVVAVETGEEPVEEPRGNYA